jgi:hypothetical protein
MWREGLGLYSILTNNKSGYENHPQTKEFRGNIAELSNRLLMVRNEMLKRGYNPKEVNFKFPESGNGYIRWQSLEDQVEILKEKGCECNIN